MTTDDELVKDRRGPVLVLRLNRPEARNALTARLVKAIGAAIVEAERDPACRAVVLTGTGEKAFCAGMDLRDFARGTSAELDLQDEAGMGFTRLIWGEVAVPVIGAANGSAVAGGLELLLGCDIVVVAQGALLGLPEVKRGLIPGGNGTFLGTRIPPAIALELVLTGDNIDAARAREIGLVNAAVPAAEVLPTAIAFAERIAANGPVGVKAAKELVRLARVDPRGARERLEEWLPVVFGSEDATEGAAAFLEKRAPVWRGR